MMHIKLYNAVFTVLEQIKKVLHQLTDEQYVQNCHQLFTASIGQHTRHVIELFQELEKGYQKGLVNYENRKRDNLIEVNKEYALECIEKIILLLHKENKNLQLQSDYSLQNNETIILETNYLREVAYNLEHTIHHMALIRIGINEVANFDIHPSFGIAPGTIKYKAKCAQ